MRAMAISTSRESIVSSARFRPRLKQSTPYQGILVRIWTHDNHAIGAPVCWLPCGIHTQNTCSVIFVRFMASAPHLDSRWPLRSPGGRRGSEASRPPGAEGPCDCRQPRPHYSARVAYPPGCLHPEWGWWLHTRQVVKNSVTRKTNSFGSEIMTPPGFTSRRTDFLSKKLCRSGGRKRAIL